MEQVARQASLAMQPTRLAQLQEAERSLWPKRWDYSASWFSSALLLRRYSSQRFFTPAEMRARPSLDSRLLLFGRFGRATTRFLSANALHVSEQYF